MRKNSLNKCLSFLISLCGVAALPQILLREGRGLGYTNSFLPVLLLLLVCPVIHRALWQDRVLKRRPFLLFLLALEFSAACGIGSRLEVYGYLDLGDWRMWLALLPLTLFFAILLGELWTIPERAKASEGTKVSGKPGTPKGVGMPEEEAQEGCRSLRALAAGWERLPVRKRRLIIFVLFLAVWSVVLLACWPGFFVYDAQDEFVQVATRQFSTHHPLPHVLLLGGIICAGNRLFGSYNAGIVCYMLFQMLLLSGCFTYVTDVLRKKNAPLRLRMGGVLYFAICPVIQVYVLCSAKDTLYSAAMLLVMVFLVENAEKGAVFETYGGKLTGLAAALFVMASMRHNGFYILLVLIPVMVLLAAFGRGGHRKSACCRALFGGVGVLAVYIAFMACLQTVLRAESGEHQEMLSVPIQQLARTFNESPESFTAEERETLFAFLPEEALAAYRPKLSDGMKVAFQNEIYEERKEDFLRLWVSVGLKAPGSYLNAWLMTSYGFWYPEAVIDVYRGNQQFTFVYGDSSWFGFETEPPGERQSRIGWLNELFRRMSLEIFQQRVPVLSMLFSPGFLFQVYALGIGFLLWKKEWGRACAFLPAILNWLTVLLGPAYLVRYVLIWWFALPVLVYVVWDRSAAS